MELCEDGDDLLDPFTGTTAAQDAGSDALPSPPLGGADADADLPPTLSSASRLPSGPAGAYDGTFGGEPEAAGDPPEHAAYDTKCVFLTVEALPTPVAKFGVALVRLSIVVATVLLGVTTWWKLDANQSSMLLDDTVTLINVVVGSLILCALLATCVYYGRGLASVRRRGLRWNRRRKRYCILGGLNLLFDLLLTIFFLTPNAYAVAHPCSWWLLDMQVFTYLRSTFFSALVSLQLLQALVLMPASAIPFYKGPAAVGIDLPASTYVALFAAAYLPLELIQFFRFATETNWFDADYLCVKFYGTESCDIAAGCRQQEYPCFYPTSTYALAITGAVITLLVIAAYFVMVVAARRALVALPYRDHRISFVELGFQLQTRAIASFFYVAGMILLGLVRINSCNSVMINSMGQTPIVIVLAMIAILQAVLATPAAADPSALKLRAWMQDPAWTEDDVPAKLAERPFQGEPCFCFETALKCFYLNAFVYDFEELPGTPFSQDVALGLWGATHSRLLWIKEQDAKCFAAWDFTSRTLSLAMRGTASMKNVLADLKAWREPHPPVRGVYWLGTRPMVHRGFLETWDDSGLRRQVLDLVENLVLEGAAAARAAPADPGAAARPWRVILTGHSLGGSMAHLAAYDIITTLKDRAKVTVYTYGCPRTGNHAFARAFRAVVPDCWDVFHADDPVAQSFKFGVMYKRGAHRVILMRRGEMLVRPLPAELSIRRGALKLTEHLLSTYAASLGSILRSEIDQEARERCRGGRAAQRAAATAAELRAMCRQEYVREVFLSTRAMRQATLLRLAGATASKIERAEAEDASTKKSDKVKSQGCGRTPAGAAKVLAKVVSGVKDQGKHIGGLHPTAAELEMCVQD